MNTPYLMDPDAIRKRQVERKAITMPKNGSGFKSKRQALIDDVDALLALLDHPAASRVDEVERCNPQDCGSVGKMDDCPWAKPGSGEYCDHHQSLRRRAEAAEAKCDALQRRVVDLDALRKAGWSVAVHNDYRLDGIQMTFWLWTHPDGRYVKGEGATDEQALAQCIETAKRTYVISGPDGLQLGQALRPSTSLGDQK